MSDTVLTALITSLTTILTALITAYVQFLIEQTKAQQKTGSKSSSRQGGGSKPILQNMKWGVILLSAVMVGIATITLLVFSPLLKSRVHCTSSSYQGDSNYCWQCTCDKAFDEKSSTRWASDWTDNEWIARDLGSPKSIDTVVLQWETAYGEAYAIEVSDNGTTWTPIYTQTNGGGGTEVIRFPLIVTRFVRMRGIARATSFGYSLWEFQIYQEAP